MVRTHPTGAAAALAVAALLLPFSTSAAQKSVVTGEVVDSACFVRVGAKGEGHRECAQRCADAGIPLALLEDGTERVIWLASVRDMETPNAKLRPYAGRRVKLTGTWAERGGARLFLVEAVEPTGP